MSLLVEALLPCPLRTVSPAAPRRLSRLLLLLLPPSSRVRASPLQYYLLPLVPVHVRRKQARTRPHWSLFLDCVVLYAGPWEEFGRRGPMVPDTHDGLSAHTIPYNTLDTKNTKDCAINTSLIPRRRPPSRASHLRPWLVLLLGTPLVTSHTPPCSPKPTSNAARIPVRHGNHQV